MVEMGISDVIAAFLLVLFVVVTMRKVIVPLIQSQIDWAREEWIVVYIGEPRIDCGRYLALVKKTGASKEVFAKQMDILFGLLSNVAIEGERADFTRDDLRYATRKMLDAGKYDPRANPNTLMGTMMAFALRAKNIRIKNETENPLVGKLEGWPSL